MFHRPNISWISFIVIVATFYRAHVDSIHGGLLAVARLPTRGWCIACGVFSISMSRNHTLARVCKHMLATNYILLANHMQATNQPTKHTHTHTQWHGGRQHVRGLQRRRIQRHQIRQTGRPRHKGTEASADGHPVGARRCASHSFRGYGHARRRLHVPGHALI